MRAIEVYFFSGGGRRICSAGRRGFLHDAIDVGILRWWKLFLRKEEEMMVQMSEEEGSDDLRVFVYVERSRGASLLAPSV